MADVRRLRDEIVRQIEKRTTAPLLSGVVADAPDTVAHTVLVRVGNTDVVAAYRGEHPQPGDPVEVQRAGAGYKVIVSIPRASVFAGAAGAPTLPQVAGGGRPPINAFTFWGHSFTHSPGPQLNTFDARDGWYPGTEQHLMGKWRIDRALMALLGLDEEHVRHWGVSGAVLCSDHQVAYPIPGILPGRKRYGWAWILQQTSNAFFNRSGWPPMQDPSFGVLNGLSGLPVDAHTHLDYQFAPFAPMNTAHVLLYGTNDVGHWGDPNATVDGVPGMMLTAWTEANRSVISRLRAGGIVENDVVYDGTGVGQRYGFTYSSSSGAAWSTVAARDYNSGASITGKTSGAGTIVFHVGKDWPGGTVTFRFRGEAATGGSVTITPPVGAPVTFSTAHRMPATQSSIVRTNEATVASTAYMTVPPWTPSYGTIARRIPLARIAGTQAVPGGAEQTITVTVNAAAGPVWFDGVDLEQTGMAPPVVVGNVPLPLRWPGAYATSPTWAGHPDVGGPSQSAVGSGDTTGKLRGPQITEAGDTWAALLNGALTTLVTEFAEAPTTTAAPTNSVVVADLFTAINGILHPEYYAPGDVLHPNVAGAAAAAGAFYRALGLATANPMAAATLGAA